MAMPLLPMAKWRWRGDDVAADGDGVAMAMPLLPSLPMLPMAIAIPLLPTEWLWGCRCCRWRVGDGVAMAMTLLPMAMA